MLHFSYDEIVEKLEELYRSFK